MMSQASRGILIQSVLSALPSFIMQTVDVPVSILNDMEKHMRSFFWNEVTGEKHMHFLAWDKICKPKNQGGLGFKNLRKMNLALLTKLGLQMLIHRDRLWVKMLWAKYGSPLAEQKKRRASKTWRSIMKCNKLLRAGLESSNFLHECRGDVGSDNFISWQGKKPEHFTVSSAYAMQFEESSSDETEKWRRVWALKGPLRANVFMWRMRHGSLPTLAFLFKRNLISTALCPICGSGSVGELHELRDCRWARQVWRLIVHKNHWRRFVQFGDMKGWLDMNLHEDLGNAEQTFPCSYIFRETGYGLWQFWNKLTHDDTMTVIPPSVFIKTMHFRLGVLCIANHVDVDNIRM